jgi:hypothetical protein
MFHVMFISLAYSLWKNANYDPDGAISAEIHKKELNYLSVVISLINAR